jgi:hypothetical protein
MFFLLLQDPTLEKVITAASPLWDYGVLGVFSLMMILLIYFLGRQFLTLHNKNLERIKTLEGKVEEQSAKIEKYLSEDRAIILDALKTMTLTVDNNNRIMAENSRVIAENSRVFEKIITNR